MAEKKAPVVTVSLSKNHDFLVIRTDNFGNLGFSESTKTGLLKIDPDRDPDEVLELAQSDAVKGWRYLGEPDRNNFYRVEPITD